MAVVVNSIELNHVNKTAKVGLYADSKSEITDGMTIEGVPAGYTLAMMSTAMTPAKDFAFTDSTGHWTW